MDRTDIADIVTAVSNMNNINDNEQNSQNILNSLAHRTPLVDPYGLQPSLDEVTRRVRNTYMPQLLQPKNTKYNQTNSMNKSIINRPVDPDRSVSSSDNGYSSPNSPNDSLNDSPNDLFF